MLQVQRLQKAYGATTVLGRVSFVLNPGEHVGLVGSNGAGKSTLLRCLIGDERPDAGTIVRSPLELPLGHLAQSFDAWHERTVGQVLSEALAEWQVAATALHDATDRLAGESGSDAALAAYQAALDPFEALGGFRQEARGAAVLDGLGLGDAASPGARGLAPRRADEPPRRRRRLFGRLARGSGLGRLGVLTGLGVSSRICGDYGSD